MSPAEAAEALVTQVEALATEGTLGHGEANSLTSTLDSALKSLEKGNFGAASNQLLALTNKVQALINSAGDSRSSKVTA